MQTSPRASENVSEGLAPIFTRDMTEHELHKAITAAMPFPVVSILFTVKDGKRHFAVNMRAESIGVFNVSWHVPISADRQLIMRSVEAARNHAIEASKRLTRQHEPES